MINTISNLPTSTLFGYNRQLKATQANNFPVSENANPVNSLNGQNNMNSIVEHHISQGRELVSNAMLIKTEAGTVESAVFWHEDSTPANPIVIVAGMNKGQPFEVTVNINEVDPRNASMIEMKALQAYGNENGQLSRQIIAWRIRDENVDAFEKKDYLTPLRELMELQRHHSNWEEFARLEKIVGFFNQFPRT